MQACRDDDAEIAKVGQMYAAWKLEGYDRCDAGWLADGSVRYPISRPRKNCSPTEAAVRFVGFPDKKVKSYGVYCFKAAKWENEKHAGEPQTPKSSNNSHKKNILKQIHLDFN